MKINEVKQIFENIKNRFPTLLSVELDEDTENKELILGFKDFNTKKEEEKSLFNLKARLFGIDDKPGFQVDLKDDIVEMYIYFGTLKFNDIDLIQSIVNFSAALTYKKNLQLITVNAGDGNIGLVLRSFIDVEQDKEGLEERLLHASKEFLSFHYSMRYNSTESKIKETLDDEEMVKTLLNKHQKTIRALLNPETMESL